MNDKRDNKTENKESVIIAMSGGVDSSVAAFLAKNSGYNLIGITLELCGDMSESIADAKAVGDKLGIKYVTCDLRGEFDKLVIEHFVNAYESAETPNPCVECNKKIKFGEIFKCAEAVGANAVVTGHYVRSYYDRDKKRYMLKKGIDFKKDQSYFLYGLTQEQLAHAIFPLGEMTKREVITIAKREGLVKGTKRESQDICFVPDGNYAEFIKNYNGFNNGAGDFIDLDGNVIGRHKGISHYTVGQRKGLGGGFSKPMYVISKNAEKNTVTLGSNDDLFSTECHVKGINWIVYDNPPERMNFKVKIRSSQAEQEAEIILVEKDEANIIFRKPQRAITKGQSAVIYDGDMVIGGGIIV